MKTGDSTYLSNTKTPSASQMAPPKHPQPWTCRALKALGRILYKETDETALFITAGRLDLSHGDITAFAGLKIMIPKIPVLKNMLTVILPQSGLSVRFCGQHIGDSRSRSIETCLERPLAHSMPKSLYGTSSSSDSKPNPDVSVEAAIRDRSDLASDATPPSTITPQSSPPSPLSTHSEKLDSLQQNLKTEIAARKAVEEKVAQMNSRCKLGNMLGNAFSNEPLVFWITGDQRIEIKEMFAERKQLRIEVEKLSQDLDIAIMLSQSSDGEGMVPKKEYDRLQKECKDVRAAVDQHQAETKRKEREHAEKEKQLRKNVQHQQKIIDRKDILLKAARIEIEKLRAGNGKTSSAGESPVYIHNDMNEHSGKATEDALLPGADEHLASDHPLYGMDSDDRNIDDHNGDSDDGDSELADNAHQTAQASTSKSQELPSTLDRDTASQKTSFDQSPEPIIEDVDEYVESLEAQRLISKTQMRDVAEDNISLKQAKARVSQLELRIDELSSAKNDMKAERDEAASQFKRLQAYLPTLDPGRTRTSMQKEIKDLKEGIDSARIEIEIECDAKDRAEDRVEVLKGELLQVEKKHLQEMKNEKKLRTAAKERLVDQLNAQHDVEIEEMKRQWEADVIDLEKQLDDKDIYWQMMVADYRILATNLFNRLKGIEDSLAGYKYPTCWHEVGPLCDDVATTWKKVFGSEDYSQLYQQASEWCPDLSDMNMSPRNVDNPLELVVVEDGDQDDYDEVKLVNAGTQNGDPEDQLGGVDSSAGNQTEEDERCAQNGSSLNGGSDGSLNGFNPESKPIFNFVSDRQPSFVFGSSSPPPASTNSSSSTPDNSPSSARFTASFQFNSLNPSRRDNEASESSAQRMATADAGPAFGASGFPIFGFTSEAERQHKSASGPVPVFNPFASASFPTFGSNTTARSEQEGVTPSPHIQPPTRPSRPRFDPYANYTG